MKNLNSFLSEMKKVAEAISKLECPDETVAFFKTQYSKLQDKSNLIGDDLDSLFKLSTKERHEAKADINLQISNINKIFETNESTYINSGYYDNSMRTEMKKFNELFFFIYKFLNNLGSTHSRSYSFNYFKLKTLEESEKKLLEISNGIEEEITIVQLDYKKFVQHLAPHFYNPLELESVLMGYLPVQPLKFKGSSSELVYVFNRLSCDGKITESRKNIILWIQKCFHFKDKKDDTFKESKFRTLYDKFETNKESIPRKNDALQKIEQFYV